MNPQNILITGGNRGIGLHFVKGLLVLKPKNLLVVCRDPDNALALKELDAENQSIHILKFDLLHQCDKDSFGELANQVEEILAGDGLNLLINNAAIDTTEDSVQDFKDTFTVNSIAPLFLGKALIPLLKKAATNSVGEGLSFSKAGVLNVSSQLGSIGRTTWGSSYGYGASKSALNMFTKMLSNEYSDDGILFVTVHPGAVVTDMTAPMREPDGITENNLKPIDYRGTTINFITTKQSVDGMLEVMSKCSAKDQGTFLKYDGEEMAW